MFMRLGVSGWVWNLAPTKFECQTIQLPASRSTDLATHLGAKIVSDKCLKRDALLGQASRILETPFWGALFNVYPDPSSEGKNP
jgi:hypothetical protein